MLTGNSGPPQRGSVKHLPQWLIAGSRGGVNRARIVEAVKDETKHNNKKDAAFQAWDFSGRVDLDPHKGV
jgi:hypothetical protein